MTFHREGRTIISTTIMALLALNTLVFYTLGLTAMYVSAFLSIVISVLVLQFFRVPNRTVVQQDGVILSPCDGKVVVIEETVEGEYFNDRRIQLSIFMSPVNVHINWFPIGGVVKYEKYHPGKYLVAWHPKSSTENERTTVVVQHHTGAEVLFRQIAGAVARRIVCYARKGDAAVQGGEFGFIKFGSRVDVFLPLGSEVHVAIDEVVSGTQTVLATFPKARV